MSSDILENQKDKVKRQKNEDSRYFPTYTNQHSTQAFNKFSKTAQENPQILNRNYELKEGSLKVPLALKRNLINCSKTIHIHDDQFLMIQIHKNILSYLMSSNKCLICQGFSTKQMFSFSNCQHRYCASCLEGYIQYKIHSSQQILCPNQGCNSMLDQNNEIFQGISDELKEKFFRQKTWRQTHQSSNKRLCPRQNCFNGVLNLLNDPPVCSQCGKRFCKYCQLEAHQGSCQSKFQQMLIGSIRCPRCSIPIKDIQINQIVKCNCGCLFCNHIQCRTFTLHSINWQQVRNYHAEQFQTKEYVPQNACFRITLGIGLIVFFPIVIITAIILFLFSLIIGVIIGVFALIIIVFSIFCKKYLPFFLFACLFIPYMIIIGIFLGISLASTIYCSKAFNFFKGYCKLMANCL